MVKFRKIAIGISGGVDSAVAAFLLKSKGYDVHAVFMKNWDSIDEMGICTTEKDFEDAKIVCKKLDIPITQVNFVKQYWNEVFTNLVNDYQMGLTPNPDILCNRKVKFKYFHEYCFNTLKVDAIATGHYANTSFGPYLENYEESVKRRVISNNSMISDVKLLQAFDKFKDQTFFLSQVKQDPLRKTMFPIAEFNKPSVRKIAIKEGLLNVATKKDSTGICFVGHRHFKKFISEYIDKKPGDFIDFETGKVVGKHSGIHQWTLGQRCHLGGFSKPYFVLRKNLNDNSICVIGGTNHPSLKTRIIITEKPNWIYGEPESLKDGAVFKCYFRYQHTKPFTECSIMKTDSGLILILEYGKRSVTPGQYAVFYNDKECYGSARIHKCGPDLYFTDSM